MLQEAPQLLEVAQDVGRGDVEDFVFTGSSSARRAGFTGGGARAAALARVRCFWISSKRKEIVGGLSHLRSRRTLSRNASSEHLARKPPVRFANSGLSTARAPAAPSLENSEAATSFRVNVSWRGSVMTTVEGDAR